jgi:predicted amidohydrolase
VISVLNETVAKFPDTDLFVLSEYTFKDPVPDTVKAWCRNHRKFLVVGGEDPVPPSNYYNTAFVVDTNGDIVFRQAKSVPVQFFTDGLRLRKKSGNRRGARSAWQYVTMTATRGSPMN